MYKFISISLATALFIQPATAEPSGFDIDEYIDCQAVLVSDETPAPEAEATCLPSASYGVPTAQFALAFILYNNERSDDGLSWLRRAADSGHPMAQYQLARILLQPNNQALHSHGKEYFRLAACAGLPQAQEYTNRFGTQPQCDDSIPKDFDGTWDAELAWVKHPTIDREPLRLRITISDGTAQVYTMADNDWREVKPGKFQMQRLDETVIVSAIDSGWDQDGKWIESWTIQLLRVAPDKAVISHFRTVNNLQIPEFTGLKTFSTLAEGDASRTDSPIF